MEKFKGEQPKKTIDQKELKDMSDKFFGGEDLRLMKLEECIQKYRRRRWMQLEYVEELENTAKKTQEEVDEVEAQTMRAIAEREKQIRTLLESKAEQEEKFKEMQEALQKRKLKMTEKDREWKEKLMEMTYLEKEKILEAETLYRTKQETLMSELQEMDEEVEELGKEAIRYEEHVNNLKNITRKLKMNSGV